MSLVVDASVLVASLVDPGHDGRWSRAALSQDGLCAPAHVLAEATNALRRMELSGRIARVQAAAAHRDLLKDDYTSTLRRARMGVADHTHQLRCVVRRARRGADLPACNARPQTRPRQRPQL